jgi:hypothetical protein
MIKVMQTKNYGMFELMQFNRDVKRTKYLEASMAEHGWIDAYPMHVKKNGGTKLLIKAGHHRFDVAQKLGIPVKFVVCEDDATIHELEKATTGWSMSDYLASFCRMGKEEYLRVKEYCDETGISLSLAASMLGGNSAGTGNFGPLFKTGNFKIKKNCDHAHTVGDVVLLMKKCGIAFASTPYAVQAISKIAWIEDIDIPKLKSKIKLFASLFEKKANLEQYLDLFEDIYNRQSREKVPLAFLAKQAAQKRSAAIKEYHQQK